MKYLLLSLIICMTSSLSFAQRTKEETAVANAVETLRKAMVDGDKTALEKIASDNLSYGHSGGKIENKAAFVEALTSGKSDFVTITLSEQTITITDNTAIVRHKLEADTNDQGKQSTTVHLAVMLVWQKQKSEWKLLARQAIKLQ